MTASPTGPRLLLAGVALSWLLPCAASGQVPVTSSTWTLQAERPIEWLRFLPSHLLLVSSDDGLQAVDPADGTVRWQREDLGNVSQVAFEAAQQTAPIPGGPAPAPGAAGPVIRVMEELPGGKLAAVLADSAGRHSWFDVIDLASGATVWSSTTLPLTEARGFLLCPDSSTLLVHGALIQPGRSRRLWLRVTVANGSVLWSSDSLLRESPAQFDASTMLASRGTVNGNQPLVLLPDSTVLLFASADGLVRFDLQTGQLRWRTPVAQGHVGPIGQGFAPLLLVGDTAYVAAGISIDAVALTDGRHLWTSAAPSAMTTEMLSTSGGLLARGQATAHGDGDPSALRPYAALLDAATGKPRWRKIYKLRSGITPFILTDGAAYLGTDEGLVRISFASASDTALTSGKLPGRPAISLEPLGDDLLLGGSQSLTLLGRDGTQRFQKEFPAPSMALGGRLLRLAVGAVAIAGGAYYSGGYLAGSAFAKYQYSTTTQASTHAYFVLKDFNGEGPALGKVDKANGEISAVVQLNGDKTPEYVIDAYSGLLLLKVDNTLTAYRW